MGEATKEAKGESMEEAIEVIVISQGVSFHKYSYRVALEGS